MTSLSPNSDVTALTASRSHSARRRMSIRAGAAPVMRAGVLLLALSSLTVPDAVLHAKWFKLGLILNGASRHYTAQS